MNEQNYSKFKELEAEVENCTALDDLFDLWKRAHVAEEDPKNTFPTYPNGKKEPDEETFKISFCRDGVTSKKGYESNGEPHVDVLFVLKESNVHGEPENGGKFWFNEDIEDDHRIRYFCAFSKVLVQLGKSSECRFGYMNLNKRGGYGRTTPERLKNYVVKYKAFIRKQIELHTPQIIVFCGCYDVAVTNVFCGRTWSGKTCCTIALSGSDPRAYYVYHPAYRNFEKSLTNLNLPIEDGIR